jgi:calnexin
LVLTTDWKQGHFQISGKWTIPKISNPEYKGVWAPRQVANPAFFEDKTPSDFTELAGIGIELWTMTEDILCKWT